MTKRAISQSMKRLPVTQRLELLEELQLSIARDEDKIPVYGWQKEILDERLKEIEEHPERGIPLEEFQGKLKQLARTLKSSRRRKSA